MSDKTLGIETGDNMKTLLSLDGYKCMTEGLPRAEFVSADEAI